MLYITLKIPLTDFDYDRLVSHLKHNNIVEAPGSRQQIEAWASSLIGDYLKKEAPVAPPAVARAPAEKPAATRQSKGHE